MPFKRKVLILALFFLFSANFYVWRFIADWQGNLEIIFFDVGQGDAIFVETPENHQILIDGGPSKKILGKLSREIPFWDRTIDLVVLTHPDYDHLAGLNYVLNRYKVENILWTGVLKTTKTFERWLERLDKEKANVFIVQRGQKVVAAQAVFFVLHPFTNLEGKLFEKATNDTSIVLKLLFSQNSFLFTGDITKKAEKELLERGDLPVGVRAEVLKVAHHGSKSSSSKEFLKEVQPKVAIISCSKNNPYGYPHEDVLSNLQDFATILRTDVQGDVKIFSDGKNLKIKN